MFVCNQVAKSREIMMFVCNQVATSREILMFVSKKMPNNAVMPQTLIVVILLANDQHKEYKQALWHYITVLCLFGTNKQSLETKVLYFSACYFNFLE